MLALDGGTCISSLLLFTLPPLFTPTATYLMTKASSYAATLPDVWILSSAGVPLSRISSIISLGEKEVTKGRVRREREEEMRQGEGCGRRGGGEEGRREERKGGRKEVFYYYMYMYMYMYMYVCSIPKLWSDSSFISLSDLLDYVGTSKK